MRYVSLSNPNDQATFQQALHRGVPEDSSSVYVPEQIPELSLDQVDSLIGADQIHIGTTLLRPYVQGEINESDLDKIVRQATTFETPIVDVGDRKVLELFHGPTEAFKDVAARYIGALFQHFYEETGVPVLVLVATSGDTGEAVAEGLADMEGVMAAVLYAKGRVSRRQEMGLRRTAANVHVAEVEGTFNDCLRLTEQAFDDPDLRQAHNLTTANSINVGRFVRQTTYAAQPFAKLGPDFRGRMVYPFGNGGNLGAGILTWHMGVPFYGGFGAGNNANNPMHRYLKTGRYEPVDTISTLSNAMDVNKPKGIGRLGWMFDGNVEAMKYAVSARTISDEATIATIRGVYDRTGYVLDPHTAVAWAASNPGDIVVSTASPTKFAEEIYNTTGIAVDNSAKLAELRQKPERYAELANEFADFKAFLLDLPHA